MPVGAVARVPALALPDFCPAALDLERTGRTSCQHNVGGRQALMEVTMYRHLLIATDGSELAEKAVAQGLALAKELGAKVTALTVTEPFASMIAGKRSTRR